MAATRVAQEKKWGARRGMLFNLLYPLSDDFGVLNVFKYLTFRTGGAMLTAPVSELPCRSGGDPLVAFASGGRAADP